MKITLDVPDTICCAFLSYVFTTEAWSMRMGCKSIGTDELHDGAEITVNPNADDGGGGTK